MATQGSNHVTAATVLLFFYLKLILQIDGWQRLVFPDPLMEHNGFCLQGLVFHTLKTNDIQVCGMGCLKQSKCKSINYDKGGKRCELNKEDQDVRTSSCFRQIDGCSYFSRKELEAMEMFLGKCRRHSCPDDTVCVPDGATSPKRYSCGPSNSDETMHRTTNVADTPLQYIGAGYNLLTGNPQMATDPGVLLHKRVLQLTESDTTGFKEASVTQRSTCTNSQQHSLVHGSTSLQNEMEAFVQASSSHPPLLAGLSFAGNADFIKARKKLDAGEDVYQDHVVTCKLGTAQYDLAGAVSSYYTVSRDFAKAVCILATLGSSYTSQYLDFLDQWGTSVVTLADFGTWTMERHRLSVPALFQHVYTSNPNVLDHAGYFNGHASSWTINMDRYDRSSLVTHSFGSPDKLTVGKLSHPDPIRMEVTPISDFMKWSYFQSVVCELKARHECVDTMQAHDLQLIANNVRSVMAQYAQHKGVTGTIDHTLQAPVTWPVGMYGLMKAASGCPMNGFQWLQGWRTYDTEDNVPSNKFTIGVSSYLSGNFELSYITTYFCMKNTHSVTSYDINWPKGSYCILKYESSSCPSGFQSGFIYWDDEDVDNLNGLGGTLPDGVYGTDTKIYYCCRDDGLTSTAISLPTDWPFILMRMSTACQTVYGMSVTEVFVGWDDEDGDNRSNRGGLHPYDGSSSGAVATNHLLYFCYYYR
ncbi:uncharacterized protein LOC128230940 [Mya arenaria]|uniref:uncharacterized protein LOC128230940 n=1 Tax=Mya arenaria TaxID=6604 RepID=UPI0022E5DD26|nr:uncharacterized protein LOC128230940 [Mya arenaria]